jgi:hypothetical protein
MAPKYKAYQDRYNQKRRAAATASLNSIPARIEAIGRREDARGRTPINGERLVVKEPIKGRRVG